ncbi:TetR/AcrR family transcriptional regulator [Mycobacterium neumannii]|uniref:TetR/AcrR family transcriptional regulator n=1 Tax=Mycobacterium neumannii TaxID=2048551 RepID=UPI003AB32251
MPRPARFTVDDLLDSAAAVVAERGPAALTILAVARAAGAPSGSMYHRFSGRAALCGELWMRTEERFIAGFAEALSGPAGTRARCVAAARHTVGWCRDHPAEAAVLLAGADALCASGWPSELHARRRRLHRRLRRLLAGLHAEADRVNAAVIDIPYAVVRRHLLSGAAIPPSADAIVTECAEALIPPV